LKPILTAHLLPLIEARLIELLRSLRPEEWELPTVAGAWTVKDVAAHLLDTETRRLSMGQAKDTTSSPAIHSPDDLVAFVNRLNRDGVETYGRLRSDDLIARIEAAAPELAQYTASLDPMARAPISVSWAGEQTSLNWFDVAREYTERWHHQQQIRLATNRPGIMTRELYYPVLDCFMRALPFKYRDRSGQAGTHLRFNVDGDCGGSWYLYRDGDRWVQVEVPDGRQVSETTIPHDIAWRIFTKGIDRNSALSQVAIAGDRDLGSHVVSMIAIVG
jgi:uncharacterized protein (TIGR03083 family)